MAERRWRRGRDYELEAEKARESIGARGGVYSFCMGRISRRSVLMSLAGAGASVVGASCNVPFAPLRRPFAQMRDWPEAGVDVPDAHPGMAIQIPAAATLRFGELAGIAPGLGGDGGGAGRGGGRCRRG